MQMQSLNNHKSCAHVYERAQLLDALEAAAKLEPNDMESSEIEPPDQQYDMLAIIAADEPGAGGKKKRGYKQVYAFHYTVMMHFAYIFIAWNSFSYFIRTLYSLVMYSSLLESVVPNGRGSHCSDHRTRMAATALRWPLLLRLRRSESPPQVFSRCELLVQALSSRVEVVTLHLCPLILTQRRRAMRPLPLAPPRRQRLLSTSGALWVSALALALSLYLRRRRATATSSTSRLETG